MPKHLLITTYVTLYADKGGKLKYVSLLSMWPPRFWLELCDIQ